MPQSLKPKFNNQPPPDEWAGFNSHKFLSVNLVQEYLEERPYLPLPADDTKPTIQEAFMTLNIMNDDPEYLINNLLLPAKNRFFPDG